MTVLTAPPFAFGVGVGLLLAALVHVGVWAGYEVRDQLTARRARPAYTGRRRAKGAPRTPTLEDLGAMSIAAMQARSLAKRPPSPHGSPRPAPPWAGRATRRGLMARLGGWHR